MEGLGAVDIVLWKRTTLVLLSLGGLEEGMSMPLGKVGRDRKKLELLGAGAEGSWSAAFRTSPVTPSACPALGILSLLLLSHRPERPNFLCYPED